MRAIISIALAMTLAMSVTYIDHANAEDATPAASAAPSAAASPGMPAKWDARIPLPPGATLKNSTAPKTGVVYSADFTATGTYEQLVKFYEEALPKSGFRMGNKVAVAKRKVYNRSFGDQEALDSVVILPSTDDPSKFTIHIAYTPAMEEPKADASAGAAAPAAAASPAAAMPY